MQRIADLIGAEADRADQAALEHGDELEKSGAVQLVRFSPPLVTAEVDEGAACVEFRIVDGVLRWHCTCRDGRSGLFCAHCVATARSVRVRTGKKGSPDVRPQAAPTGTFPIAS
ncbi:hypothetical protein [Streptosporangium lutulentum]|uniref:Zn finger protein n=1 Tax=Streptosporangium lutulentum TaxID=1461250 RepID=A0ABT9QKF9_9ACTN|nr:hypothetical protein [Streptosporangium lutulentum]MDP9847199.1 putative Zn finger protein [Streptosporangium lutulentum]